MATTTSNYPSKVSTRPRVLDVKEGYASYPEGFVHINGAGRTHRAIGTRGAHGPVRRHERGDGRPGPGMVA